MDPFVTLGLEPRFDIDLKAAEQRHRDLSKTLHPDRYASAPAAERRLALGKAIEVNEAWRLLKDPVRRAEALLRGAGVAVGETAEPKASPALLMEMMEIREALAEARQHEDLAAAGRLAAVMRARQDQLLGAIAAGFAKGEHTAVVPILGELRYVRRFLDEVAAIEEELTSP